MIDKITISLSDSGQFSINVGDIQFITANSPMECMREVNNYLRKLAHFPTGLNPMNANPIPYDDFKSKKK